MGVRILVGNNEGDSHGAVLYDSTSGWAFGPVFDDYDAAESFVESLDVDARTLSDSELDAAFRRWFEQYPPAPDHEVA